jgi:hypothetical protein
VETEVAPGEDVTPPDDMIVLVVVSLEVAVSVDDVVPSSLVEERMFDKAS